MYQKYTHTETWASIVSETHWASKLHVAIFLIGFPILLCKQAIYLILQLKNSIYIMINRLHKTCILLQQQS